MPKGHPVPEGYPDLDTCPLSKRVSVSMEHLVSTGSSFLHEVSCPYRCPLLGGAPSCPAQLHGMFYTLLTPWHSWISMKTLGNAAFCRGPLLTQPCPRYTPSPRAGLQVQLIEGLWQCFNVLKRGLGSLRGALLGGLAVIPQTGAVNLLLCRENRALKCI